MKAIPGKIVITDKVYFEYYDDGKPEHKLLSEFFGFDTEKYEASKQLIEVDNYAYRYVIKRKYPYIYSIKGHPGIKDNQPCKAEIKGGSAKIIELTKE